MPKTEKFRDVEKYRLLPPLDPETYSGLRANIAINGVQVPVVKDERGYILDGFARARIAKELDYELPSVTVKRLTEQEKRSHVRALNLARRQLDYAAKRQIIADELKENPDRSNRWVAKSLGAVAQPPRTTWDHPGRASRPAIFSRSGSLPSLPPLSL
jgi:ParB-like chromosome segregation protein Spo0J